MHGRGAATLARSGLTADEIERAPRLVMLQWYVFPELTPDEVVVFRTYDTGLIPDPQATFFTPHSAFRDPDVDVGNPARFSIELRVMCLFT